MQEAKSHHFVPKFVLKKWLVPTASGEKKLLGYQWNRHGRRLECKPIGVKGVCCKNELLTLSSHELGRDALESRFFGNIDTQGADARDALLENGPNSLTVDQRCDFARLVLSLLARQPDNVQMLRNDGRDCLAGALDADPDIANAMDEDDVSCKTVEYAEKFLGQSLEDRALSCIVPLVDNPVVGKHLINAQWMVKRLDQQDGTLVLSDSPVIRTHGCDRPGCVWVLPLTPNAAFVACNHEYNFMKLSKLSGRRFVRGVNTLSAAQARRFVFCVDDSHKHWLGKYLSAERRIKPHIGAEATH